MSFRFLFCYCLPRGACLGWTQSGTCLRSNVFFVSESACRLGNPAKAVSEHARTQRRFRSSLHKFAGGLSSSTAFATQTKAARAHLAVQSEETGRPLPIRLMVAFYVPAIVIPTARSALFKCARGPVLWSTVYRPSSFGHSRRAVTMSSNDSSAQAPTMITTVEPPETSKNPVLLYSIVTKNATEAAKWYEDALGAEKEALFNDKNGKVMHCVLKTPYDMRIALEDDFPEYHLVDPVGPDANQKPSPGSYVYITLPKDGTTADQAVEKMRAAGAKVVKECVDTFYGHRIGMVIDKYGLGWTFAHEIEKASV